MEDRSFLRMVSVFDALQEALGLPLRVQRRRLFSFCRRDSILATNGLGGTGDCIGCVVETGFRLQITLEWSTWARMRRPRSSIFAFADVVSLQELLGHKASAARAQTVLALQ